VENESAWWKIKVNGKKLKAHGEKLKAHSGK
jgi:hypothetical protein